METGWSTRTSWNRTHAVGELTANPFGLFDIHGNAWEWVHDSWDSAYYDQFEKQPAVDPSGPIFTGSWRVLRGGHWLHPASTCRTAFRYGENPTARYGNVGFRVSLTVDAVKAAITQPPPPAKAPFKLELG